MKNHLSRDRRSTLARTLQSRQQALSAVTEAQQRLQSGDYGVCVYGYQAIPFERLQIEPEALRCTACQSVTERSF